MKTYKIIVDGRRYEGKVVEYTESKVVVRLNNVDYTVGIEHEEYDHVPKLVRRKKQEAETHIVNAPKKVSAYKPGQLLAPIPGVVLSVLVKEGDIVKEGDVVLILEAMKMESEITAKASGPVTAIRVAKGENVAESQVLLEIGEQ